MTNISLGRILLISGIVFLVTMVSALVFAEAQSPVHVAEVEVLVDLGSFGSRAQADRELATYEVIGRSRVVLEAIADRTGVATGEIGGGLSIDVVGSSSVLAIRGSHEESETALAIVAAAADAFVDVVSTNTSAALRTSIQLEIDDLVETLASIDTRLTDIDATQNDSASTRVSAEEQRLLAESETLLARMSILQDRLFDLELNDTSRLEKATTLGQPRLIGQESAVGGRQAVAIGGLAGLVLASLVGALLWQMVPWVDPDEESVEPEVGGEPLDARS